MIDTCQHVICRYHSRAVNVYIMWFPFPATEESIDQA